MEQPPKKPGRRPGEHKIYPVQHLSRMTHEQDRRFRALVRLRQAEQSGYKEASLLRDLVDEEAKRQGLW